MLIGSCACGRVRYEIHGELLGPITYCHCWRCRKHSGSSFGTTAGVKAAEFLVVSAKELLSNWESSPGVRRFFASCCGSPIYKSRDDAPEILGLRLGTLDSDASRTAALHFMVSSKAPWLEIKDGLPQEPGGLPFGDRDSPTVGLTSIAVAWLLRGTRILLGKRSETMRLYPGKWDAIGGHIESGESAEAAVRRELTEETGVSAAAVSLVGTFEKPNPLGPGALCFHVFAITAWKGSPRLANAEHSELRWFELAEAAEMDLSHSEYQPLLAALRAER